jgi:hypothetical protein
LRYLEPSTGTLNILRLHFMDKCTDEKDLGWKLDCAKGSQLALAYADRSPADRTRAIIPPLFRVCQNTQWCEILIIAYMRSDAYGKRSLVVDAAGIAVLP